MENYKFTNEEKKYALEIMKKSFCISLLFVVFLFCSAASPITKEKKMIFLLDVSGSMAGLGNVNTDNVFNKAKEQLIKATQVYRDSCVIEIIPFTHNTISFSNADTANIENVISSINLQKGHSNIEKAWDAGIGAIDSSKSNYLFLITDGVHNFGIPHEDLYKKIAKFSQIGKDKDCNAYYLVLSEKYRENDIAAIFKQNERMFVVDSLINLPGLGTNAIGTNKGTPQSILFKKAFVDTDASNSKIPWKIFLWIILIAILLILLGLIISKLPFMWCRLDSISQVSTKAIRFLPFLDKCPRLLKNVIYNILPEKKKKILESLWELTNKYGKKQPDPNDRPKRFNPQNRTYRELFKKYNFKLKFKNGSPNFSKISKCTIKVSNLYDKYSNFERRGGGNNVQDEIGKRMAKDMGMSEEEFWDYKSKNGLTIHECPDGKTFMLVPKEIHDNINHFGGISVAKRVRDCLF